MLAPNFLTRAVDTVRPAVDALPAEQAADLESALDLTAYEHFAYQNAQARAHAMGRLTTEEASFIYRALGESCGGANGGWAAGVDLATKVVVTQVMPTLLKRS